MTPPEFDGSWTSIQQLSAEILDYWGMRPNTILNIVNEENIFVDILTLDSPNIDMNKGEVIALCHRYSISPKKFIIFLASKRFKNLPLKTQYFILLHEHCHIKEKGHGEKFQAVLKDLMKAFGVKAVWYGEVFS